MTFVWGYESHKGLDLYRNDSILPQFTWKGKKKMKIRKVRGKYRVRLIDGCYISFLSKKDAKEFLKVWRG